MLRIKMQHHSCDFAPVSTLRIRVEQPKIRDDVLFVALSPAITIPAIICGGVSVVIVRWGVPAVISGGSMAAIIGVPAVISGAIAAIVAVTRSAIVAVTRAIRIGTRGYATDHRASN